MRDNELRLSVTLTTHEPASGFSAGCGWLGFGVVRELCVICLYRLHSVKPIKGQYSAMRSFSVFMAFRLASIE